MTLKKYFFVILSCCLLGTFSTAEAQRKAKPKPNNDDIYKRMEDKNRPFEGSKYGGNIRPRKRNNSQVGKYKGSMSTERLERSKRTGTDKFIGPVGGDIAPKVKVGGYSGEISQGAVDKSRKRAAQNIKKASAYKGNVPYVDWDKIRASKAKKMAAYKGFIVVKRKPAKSSTHTEMKRFYPASYQYGRLRKGVSGWNIKRSDIPNYQLEKAPKLAYDKGENKIWAQPRKIPKQDRSRSTEEKNPDGGE